MTSLPARYRSGVSLDFPGKGEWGMRATRDTAPHAAEAVAYAIGHMLLRAEPLPTGFAATHPTETSKQQRRTSELSESTRVPAQLGISSSDSVQSLKSFDPELMNPGVATLSAQEGGV